MVCTLADSTYGMNRNEIQLQHVVHQAGLMTLVARGTQVTNKMWI